VQVFVFLNSVIIHCVELACRSVCAAGARAVVLYATCCNHAQCISWQYAFMAVCGSLWNTLLQFILQASASSPLLSLPDTTAFRIYY
jgi:hypothetical protein